MLIFNGFSIFVQFLSLTTSMEEDGLSFDRTIHVVQNQTNINMGEILEKYNITSKCKAQLHIVSFCKWFPCQLLNLLSRLIFWRWSKPFIWDIRKETRFFYLSPTNWKGVWRKLLFYNRIHGMNISSGLENEWFEKLL